MRISDWSSDVCSSDLKAGYPSFRAEYGARNPEACVGSCRRYQSLEPGFSNDTGQAGYGRLTGSARNQPFRTPPTVPLTLPKVALATGHGGQSGGRKTRKKRIVHGKIPAAPHPESRRKNPQ